MSVQAMAECWGESFPVDAAGLSKHVVRLVALAVADVVNDLNHNEFWGSRRLLAAKVGIDPDTVSDVMRHLTAAGVIEEVSRPAGRSVIYRWIGPPDSSVGSGNPPPPPEQTCGADTVGGGGAVTAGVAVLSPPHTKRTQSKTQPSSSPNGDGVGFDAFWELYPRKTGRAEALKTWVRQTKGNRTTKATAAEVIVAGLQARVAWWARARTPMEKIPHATTWLNQQRWADELEPAPATKAASRAQAHADVDARVRDEFEDAVTAGDYELAWQIFRHKAAATDLALGAIAERLEEGLAPRLIQRIVTHMGGEAVTADEVASVVAARADIAARCAAARGEPLPSQPMLEPGDPPADHERPT